MFAIYLILDDLILHLENACFEWSLGSSIWIKIILVIKSSYSLCPSSPRKTVWNRKWGCVGLPFDLSHFLSDFVQVVLTSSWWGQGVLSTHFMAEGLWILFLVFTVESIGTLAEYRQLVSLLRQESLLGIAMKKNTVSLWAIAFSLSKSFHSTEYTTAGRVLKHTCGHYGLVWVTMNNHHHAHSMPGFDMCQWMLQPSPARPTHSPSSHVN